MPVKTVSAVKSATQDPCLDVQLHVHRCPFCHDDIRPAEECWAACEGCLARHHEACWAEAGSCAACRHPVLLEPSRSKNRSWPRRLLTTALTLFVLLCVLLVGVTGSFLAIAPQVALSAPSSLDPALDRGVRLLRAACNDARRDAITTRGSNFLIFYRRSTGDLAVQRFRAGFGFVGDPSLLPAEVRIVETKGNPALGFSTQIKGSAIPIFDQRPDPDDPALFAEHAPRLDTGVQWLEIQRDGTLDSDPTRYVDFELFVPDGQRLRVTLSPHGRVRVAVGADH